MKHKLSDILFKESNSIKMYLNEFEASNTGNNIEAVEDNESTESDFVDAKDGSELADDIQKALDKHKNESVTFTTSDIVLNTLSTLNFKNYDYLNEENAKASSPETEESDSSESDSSESDEKDGKIKKGDKLDADDLTADKSIKHAELQTKIMPAIMDKIKSSSTKIQDMLKKFKDIDYENPSEEDKDFINSYVDKVKEGNAGDGLVDIELLRKLFNQGFTISSLGKTILNPMQMKPGADQQAGVTAADIAMYKKLKMIPFFAMTKKGGEVETVSGHKGDKNYYIVFVCPAFGAIIEKKEELIAYQKIFPTFCSTVDLKIGDTIVDSDELNFCYVEGDEALAELQKRFVPKFLEFKKKPVRSDGQASEEPPAGEGDKEKVDDSVFESFVYKKGLSFLLTEENVKFPTKRFVDIVTDEEDEDGQKKRKFDPAKIEKLSSKITHSNYRRFVDLAHQDYLARQKQGRIEKTEALSTGIQAVSDISKSLTKAYMGTGIAAGALTSAVSFTAGLGTLSMLPYVLGAKMATPGLAAAAKGITSVGMWAVDKHKEKVFKEKDINSQIPEMLGMYLASGESPEKVETRMSKIKGTFGSKDKSYKTIYRDDIDFKSVEDEAKKLQKALISLVDETLKLDDQVDDEGTKRKENVLITQPDFETACNQEDFQLTQINAIPPVIYLDFLIDCNDLLRQSKIEIENVSKYSSDRKTGGGFYNEVGFGNQGDGKSEGEETEEDKKLKEEILKQKIEDAIEFVESIPDETKRLAILKQAILLKLKQGDLEKAQEFIERLFEDPDLFAKNIEEFADGDDSDSDEVFDNASKVTGEDAEKIKERYQDQTVVFITQEEINILEILDKKIAEAFGVKSDEYSKLTKKFNFECEIKCITYRKRKSLGEKYAKKKHLFRPSMHATRKSYSFGSILNNLKKSKKYNKKQYTFLKTGIDLMIAGVLYGQSAFEEYSDLAFDNIKKNFKEGNEADDIKRILNIITNFVRNSEIILKMKEAQEESQMIIENKYYNNTLTDMLFENNLGEFKF